MTYTQERRKTILTLYTLNTIVSRDLRYLFQRPGSRAQFARNTYLSPSVISKWTADPPAPISLYDAKLVTDYFGVSLDWLITNHKLDLQPAYRSVVDEDG